MMAKKPTYEELEQRVKDLEKDAAKHRKAEGELRASEARFKRASNNSPAVLYQFLMAPGGEVSFPYVSDVIVAAMGITPEEVMKDPSKLLGMVHPDDQKMFQEGINRAAETLTSFPLTFRCLNDGEVIWIEARGIPTPLADGGILWDGFLLDITDRKRAEEALRESEEKYSKFFHSNPQWLHISTLEDGCYVEVNDAVKEITGYERDELIGRTSKELGLWTDYEERSRLVEIAKEQGGFREQEVVFIKKNGELVPVLWSAATIELMGTAYFINSVTDITERKHAEEARREIEAQYREIVEGTDDLITRVDKDGKFVYVNHISHKIFGLAPEDCIGKPAFDFIHPDDRKRTIKWFEEKIAMSQARGTIENRQVNGDGEIHHILWTAAFHYNNDGNAISINSIARDITARKRTEEALQNVYRELEQKVEERTAGLRKTTDQLEALMNATTDTALLLDMKGCAVAVNNVTAKRFGMSPDQFLGTCVYDLMPPPLAKSRKAKIDRVIKTGKPQRFEDERKGIIFDSTIYPVLDRRGKVAQVAVYGKDITKRVKAYRELEQNERELKEKTSLLQDANMALKILLQKSSENRKDVEEEILTILKKRIAPYISNLKQCDLDKNMRDYVRVLESNLKEIVSPFSRDLSFEYMNLTPKEIEIANLIRENRTTKQISKLLKVSPGTIDHHRNNIRNKLEIKNKKKTLKSYLKSI